MNHNLEREEKKKIREIVLDYFILRKKRQGEKQDAIYYGG